MSTTVDFHLSDENIITHPDHVVRVSEFYNGRNIFITGVSGFMGKVLLEKLLWSCESIGNIYIMLREKRGVGLQDRLKKILDTEIFQRIKQRNKESLKKVIAIKGELIERNLGMSDADIEILQKEVSIVFHLATSVKFEEPLNKAILTNVRGTRDLLEISRGMKNLAAFIYVSTIYTNSYNNVIEEKVYTKDADWKEYIQMAEVLKHDLNCFKFKLTTRHPNSYTFTKFLTENCVNDYRYTIPVVIFRPSIVSFCIEEPLPGWIGNFYGPFQLWPGICTGVVHIVNVKLDNCMDFIPCNYAIDALILSAWYRGNKNTDKCITINAAAGESKKETGRRQFELAYSAIERQPFINMLWFPSFHGIVNFQLYILLFILRHMIPAIFLDINFKLQGSKIRLLPIYRKVFLANNALSFYVTNQWSIINKNYYKLMEFMHPDDYKVFKIDMHNTDYVKCSQLMIEGIKRFVLKEGFDKKSLEKARKTYERKYALDCFLKALLLSLTVYLIYKFWIYSLCLAQSMISFYGS